MRKLYFLMIFIFSTTALRAMKRREMPATLTVVDNKMIWEREVRSAECSCFYRNDVTGHWKLYKKIDRCHTDDDAYERIKEYTVGPNEVSILISRFRINKKTNVRTSIDDGKDREDVLSHDDYDQLDQRRGGSVVVEFLVPMRGGTLTGTGMD